MPTVFWSGTFERCGKRVLSLIDRSASPVEAVFVFDGVAPPAPDWLDRPDVTVVSTGRRSGPAIARNVAAQAAGGDILFFVDADVELSDDAIDQVLTAFEEDDEIVGLFGAYDDEPAGDGIASSFRNLLHHHTHVSHPGTAGTFWSGCGAIRAGAFFDVGGFDEKYAYPSVEDIELGMRITANGGRILLAPQVRCKHLKRWTLVSMVLTDIIHRAKPWTHLIMNSQRMPAALNLDWRGRLGGICAMLLVACLVATIVDPRAAWGAAACAAALFAMHIDFYRLCLRKRGFGFAIAAMALHWFYFLYSSLTFGVVAIQESLRRFGRSSPCIPPASLPRATGLLPESLPPPSVLGR